MVRLRVRVRVIQGRGLGVLTSYYLLTYFVTDSLTAALLTTGLREIGDEELRQQVE